MAATATLNLLAGPTPLEEYVRIVREEEQLIARLIALTEHRVRLELTLRVAGRSRQELFDAQQSATE